MATKKDISSPKKGMNKDSHESELQKQEYSFALNTNFHDEHGNGPVVLQNEPSNIKCTTFKPGYVVIGHKYDINANRTYFFITNPTTKDSEIGYIDGNQNFPTESFNVNDCNCDPSAVLDPPLEAEQQVETCNYVTIISDICEGTSTHKLNFNVDYPIYENNIQLKDEKSGKVLYFTDNYNPQRYIQLDYLNQYYKDIDLCTGDEVNACLDVDKMRIFKLFNKPCSKVDVVVEGGNLKAGMYEVIVAYSDSDSNILSNWYSLTNPTPIFDKNNNILDQTNLDYMTNKGITVEFTDLDTEYNFYTVAVIYRSGLDLSVSYFTYGTYPIDTQKISIYSMDDRPRDVTLADFLVAKPFYKRAQGMTNSNGFLFQYGVEQQREINLQPVVNLMGAYAKWTAYIAKENLYEDGSNVSNFTGYMRDEVYPYGIKFFMKGGYETQLFPLIARPPKDFETINSDLDLIDSETAIPKFNRQCSTNVRNKVWQYANTATKDVDFCTYPAGLSIETKTVTRAVQGSCIATNPDGSVQEVDEILNGTLTIVSNLGLVDYINSEDGRAEMTSLQEDGDEQFDEILAIITDPDQYDASCEPKLAGTCFLSEDTPIDSQEIFAIGAENVVQNTTLMCLDNTSVDQYTIRAQKPKKAYNLEMDFTTGAPVQDLDFIKDYFGGSLFDRKDVSNNSPSDAKAIPFLQSPQVDFAQWVEHAGYLVAAAANSQFKTTPNADFLHDKVSANAIWYTASLDGRNNTIIELTQMNENDKDDLTLDPTKIRVTVYDGEPTGNTTPKFVKFITLKNNTLLDELIFMVSKENTLPCATGTNSFPQTEKFKKDSVYIAVDTTRTEKETVAVKIPIFNGLAIHLSKQDESYGESERARFFYQATAGSPQIDCGAVEVQLTLPLAVNNYYNSSGTPESTFSNFLSEFGLSSRCVNSAINGQSGNTNGDFLIVKNGPNSTFPYMMGWKNIPETICFDCEIGIEPSQDAGVGGWWTTTASITFANPSLTITYTVPSTYSTEGEDNDVKVGKIFPPKNAEEFAKKLLETNASIMSAAGILGFVNDDGVMVFRGPVGFSASALTFTVNPDTTTAAPYLNPFSMPGGFGLGYGLKLEIDNELTGKTIISRPTRGVFNIYQREPVYKRDITFESLNFGKKQVKNYICQYNIPILDNCLAVPYSKGDFSYWESTERYPCNSEMFDSSNIEISLVDIPPNKRAGLLYYADEDLVNNKFIWKNDSNNIPLANFMERGIRHYKYPDNSLIPFMSDSNMAPDDFKSSNIFPLAFNIDKEVITMFLDVAESNKLITKEERDSIISYEIYRGDRRIDRTIIAKGLLFDMYRSIEPVEYYSNYPLNTLGRDSWNGSTQDHMFSSIKNNMFTMHSPSTHFYKPTLPNELQIDGIVYGKSRLMYDEVRGHSTYILLGKKAKTLAASLAAAETFFETATYAGDLATKGAAGGLSSALSITVAAVSTAAFIAAQVIKTGQYRLQWLTTLKNLGSPRNFAYYQTAIGYYNYFDPYEPVDFNQNNFEPQYVKKIRGIESSSYLREGMWQVSNERSGDAYKVNNLDREDSVFISVEKPIEYPEAYVNYDNETVNRKKATRKGYSETGRSSEILGNCASMYATLKRYSPSQYGFIHSIEWLSTGYCRTFEDDFGSCDAVFGGDTYISRFSVKRKFPFFTSNAIGLAPLVPFAYSNYFNINPKDKTGTRYFINYEIDTNADTGFTLGSLFFPSNDSELNFDYFKGANMYIAPPSKFYLFSYGFPYFLVESEINCNYRYARREPYENFYPNTSDVIEFTQEQNVSIREPNTYFYNPVYSATKSKSRYSLFPTNYNEEYYNKISSGKNTVIYSAQDSSETSSLDAWLQYFPNDFYIFPSSYGDLVDMFGIESEQVIARFTNGVSIFGAIDVLKDRLTPETRLFGAGGIFNARSMSFNKTDLGYAGTQHKSKVSCSFGHFFVDAMRGKVFNLKPSAQGIDDITVGLEKWFKQNLPFNCIKTFSDINIDNNFKNIGITLGWDDRFKRLFLTKRDYKIVKNPVGKPELKFNRVDGFYTQVNPEAAKINVPFSDTAYFKDCSFTLAYSPLTESWISYYSFKPNFYITYNDYFQTGLNYPDDPSEKGLWSHFPFTSSYQVFYGKLYPFTVEYPMLSAFSQSSITTIEYWLEARKYYNQWDFADAFGIGFNKAIIYNATQNTGLLNLNHQKNNDLSQQLKYPKYNISSTDILQTEIGGKWAFNYLYNIVKNEKSTLPVWLNDISNVDKLINSTLLNYKPTFKDRMRGDYFLVRLSQDIESRFKLLFRFAVDERDYYEQ